MTRHHDHHNEKNFKNTLAVFLAMGGDVNKGIPVEEFKGLEVHKNSDNAPMNKRDYKSNQRGGINVTKDRASPAKSSLVTKDRASPAKSSLVTKDRASPAKSSNKSDHVLDRVHGNKDSAIILTVTSDVAVHGCLHFDIGQASNDRFIIEDSGSKIKFKVSGLYFVQFEGVLLTDSEKIELEFVRIPSYDEKYKSFYNFTLPNGHVGKSTLLKFEAGNVLYINIRSDNDDPVAIGDSSSLIVFKVDDSQ
jgi:hypothetical protein